MDRLPPLAANMHHKISRGYLLHVTTSPRSKDAKYCPQDQVVQVSRLKATTIYAIYALSECIQSHKSCEWYLLLGLLVLLYLLKLVEKNQFRDRWQITPCLYDQKYCMLCILLLSVTSCMRKFANIETSSTNLMVLLFFYMLHAFTFFDFLNFLLQWLGEYIHKSLKFTCNLPSLISVKQNTYFLVIEQNANV